MAEPNLLYYGDNLDVLRRHVASASVDLVYLDPPFNSNATYNVLFRQHNDTLAASQIEAFGDTWRWDTAAAEAYEETVEAGGSVAQAMRAFNTLLGPSDMLAYLSMMAPRLVELRRVLKPTGSLYLHCDPTASHYLKLLLDSVIGADNFKNELIWKRTTPRRSRRSPRGAPERCVPGTSFAGPGGASSRRSAPCHAGMGWSKAAVTRRSARRENE